MDIGRLQGILQSEIDDAIGMLDSDWRIPCSLPISIFYHLFFLKWLVTLLCFLSLQFFDLAPQTLNLSDKSVESLLSNDIALCHQHQTTHFVEILTGFDQDVVSFNPTAKYRKASLP